MLTASSPDSGHYQSQGQDTATPLRPLRTGHIKPRCSVDWQSLFRNHFDVVAHVLRFLTMLNYNLYDIASRYSHLTGRTRNNGPEIQISCRGIWFNPFDFQLLPYLHPFSEFQLLTPTCYPICANFHHPDCPTHNLIIGDLAI